MKCPNCGDRGGIDINNHSEGFSNGTSPVKECGKCGLIWRIKMVGNDAEVDIIKPAEVAKHVYEPDFTEAFNVS